MNSNSEDLMRPAPDLFAPEGHSQDTQKRGTAHIPVFTMNEEKGLPPMHKTSEHTIPENIEPPKDKNTPMTMKNEITAISPVRVEVSENAMTVLKRRYLKKDENGTPIEAPEDMFRRVAHFVAAADKAYGHAMNLEATEEAFYGMMARLEFLPNSPTLMNAGRDLGQLSACFVLPVEDSMESIFDAVKYTALIHKSGGGTGFSFSRIRPQNDIVRSTLGVASGPISFLQVFDSATETVKQGGTRRGANMAIIRVDHPDILDFINAKENNDHLNNFNISVAITEKFWKALEQNRDYELINPHSGDFAGSLNAKSVFQEIVNHAWENGDPGVVFIDKINDDNPVPQLGAIEATNPCGEQPLLPYESCNLGSINLSKMVKLDKEGWSIDYDKLQQTVHHAVHFLDNVIDVNKYPIHQIADMSRTTRKIGLGVMGFADMLIRIGTAYDSVHAIELARKVMGFINEEARAKSRQLALERGAFPAFEDSVYARNGEEILRNATCTTIAPTGTISIIAGCSSGVEPLFALAFTRHVMDDDKLAEVHPIFLEDLKASDIHSSALIDRVIEHGSIQNMNDIPQSMRSVYLTSHDIDPEWHIRMQAAFQEHTDNAVSKTVNFPNSATHDDVATVYQLAHDLGCKGVTIYRDGSRDVQVLNKGKQTDQTEEHVRPAPLNGHNRPQMLRGFTTKLNTGQGSLYVTINSDERKKPVEVFANIGKSGGDTAALSEAIGRLISIALQNHVSVEEVAKTLIGITGSRPVWNAGSLVKSVPDAIGQIMLEEFKHLREEAVATAPAQSASAAAGMQELILGPECPECGSHMETEGGCSVCHACGYSHCG